MSKELKELYERLHREHTNTKGQRYSSTDLGWFSEGYCRNMKSILDVGAGLSPYAARVKSMYQMHRAVVVDISEEVRSFHENLGVEFYCRDLEQGFGQVCCGQGVTECCGSPDVLFENFDVVTCFDCLEHLQPAYVNFALCELYRVAKYRLIISVGQVSSKAQDIELHLTQQNIHEWINQIITALEFTAGVKLPDYNIMRVNNPHNYEYFPPHPYRNKGHLLSDFIVVDKKI